jgi:hypothetical protein
LKTVKIKLFSKAFAAAASSLRTATALDIDIFPVENDIF